AHDSDSIDESLIDDLATRCTSELPRFKRPVEIAVVSELPRAATGKVQRSRLRQLAASGAN
ncbi:MAG TPA: p-hydroxycinnamoyl-CoA synthetase, partial [Galbitalea sp.]|nr:p-hydroxycinnamoyl-CoA synthetase [Galbitalea sp.]